MLERRRKKKITTRFVNVYLDEVGVAANEHAWLKQKHRRGVRG